MASLPNKSIRSRFIAGAVWSVAGSGVGQTFLMVGFVIAARILGPAGYGELTLVYTSVAILTMMISSPIALTATRSVAESLQMGVANAREVVQKLSAITFWVTGFLSILCVFIAPVLSDRFVAVRVLEKHHFLVVIYLIAACHQAVQLGVLTGLEAFPRVAVVGIIKGALVVAGMALAAGAGSVTGTLLLLSFSTCVGVALAHIFLKNEFRRRPCKNTIAGHLNTSLRNLTLPLTLSAASTMPAIWWSNALLAQASSGMEQVGLFNAANQWRLSLVMLYSLATAPLLPILTKIWTDQKREGFKKILLAVSGGVFVITVILTFVVYFVSDSIAFYIFGKDYVGIHRALFIMSLSSIFSGTAAVVGVALQAMGLMWATFWLNGIWTVSFVFVCFWNANLGAEGIAFGYLVAYVIHGIISMAYAFYKISKY